MAEETTRKGQPRSRELARTGQNLPQTGFDPFLLNPAEFFGTNPFSLMRRMQERMDNLLAQSFAGASPASGGAGPWAPAIEVNERDNKLVVTAELPGLNPNEVNVEVKDDALVIQGERKQEREEEAEGFRRSERCYGRFYRAISLPEGANPDQAQAEFRNGVLEVTIPIAEERTKKRQIPIRAAEQAGPGREKTTEQRKTSAA